jgi:hypothetical protein
MQLQAQSIQPHQRPIALKEFCFERWQKACVMQALDLRQGFARPALLMLASWL